MINLPVRIAISGVTGRMGQQLILSLLESDKARLSAAIVRENSKLCGVDVGELVRSRVPLHIEMNDNLSSVKDHFDILIDFTHPDASIKYLDFCRIHEKGMVIGTTGFSAVQKLTINEAANQIGVVFSSNFSVGINLMLKLLQKTSQVIGEKADIEIIEAHHRHKVDAPSGTAISMGEVISNALGQDLSKLAIYNRAGYIGEKKEKSIGFSTVRAGDIIGEHTALFAAEGERLEITHKAYSRKIFAMGALRAAIWLSKEKKKGLFDMIHVLNLDKL